jgi:hypothetical protein
MPRRFAVSVVPNITAPENIAIIKQPNAVVPIGKANSGNILKNAIARIT